MGSICQAVAHAVIFYGNKQFIVPVEQLDRRLPGLGVFMNVLHQFRHDPVEVQFHFGGQSMFSPGHDK